MINRERESTKVRVCLDSKSKYKGVSVNDALLKGRLEMTDILQAITRFRAGRNAILGDIKKMFWQIRLSEEDQMYHGVIWDGNTYAFTRVCFGDKNSPPIADYSMKKIAAVGKDDYPLAYETLMNKRYVDDIADASSNEQLIINKRQETEELLGKFGFQIKQWYSNNQRVGVSANDQKVLGLKWDMGKDELSLAVSNSTTSKNTFTKREVLSKIASMWDPLGICAGYLTKGRLIFQSIVRLKLRWDDDIGDTDLYQKWTAWVEQMFSCEDMIIGRSIVPTKPIKNYPDCQLVGFCDGSATAYGCALYLRWASKDESETEVMFLGSKGKVGPISGNTVPRQELCGALLLSRMTNSVENALAHTELKDLLSTDTKLFCDSTTVIRWVNADAINYRPYVKNKVIEIQDLQATRRWSHIPTQENKAADLISKGCNVTELRIVHEGPRILRKSRDTWVKQVPRDEKETTPDDEAITCNQGTVTKTEDDVIDLSKFSSYK